MTIYINVIWITWVIWNLGVNGDTITTILRSEMYMIRIKEIRNSTWFMDGVLKENSMTID